MTRSGALPAKMILFACGAWLAFAGVYSGRAAAGPYPQNSFAAGLEPDPWWRAAMPAKAWGRRADALADYTLAIESRTLSDAEQARVLFDRGLLLDGMGRLDDALSDYSAALSLAPNFAAALNNRANIYRRTGHLVEARHDYLASLAAGNRQSQYPYYGLGQIAEAQGDKSAAREFYHRALAARPRLRSGASQPGAPGAMARWPFISIRRRQSPSRPPARTGLPRRSTRWPCVRRCFRTPPGSPTRPGHP